MFFNLKSNTTLVEAIITELLTMERKRLFRRQFQLRPHKQHRFSSIFSMAKQQDL